MDAATGGVRRPGGREVIGRGAVGGSAAQRGAVLLLMAGTAAADPLPSWRDGGAKRAITSCVERTTTPGHRDFVPPEDRIVVFDNDCHLAAAAPARHRANSDLRAQP